MSKNEKSSNPIVIKTIDENTDQSIKDFYHGKVDGVDKRHVEDRMAMNLADYGNFIGNRRKKKKQEPKPKS